MEKVKIIGGGLAGSEAAWQLAKRKIPVEIYEMRPVVTTPVHKTEYLAELVCSNSFKSTELTNASGLLKEEMKKLDSLLLRVAEETRVPAGVALAVDRELFAKRVQEILLESPYVTVIREEVKKIPEEGIVIVATGPLTSSDFAEHLIEILDTDSLYFYDAVSPIIYADSINYEKVFSASRYGKGEEAYLNCPMTKEEYERFVEELVNAETVESHYPGEEKFFEGCLPIEVLARRGIDTLRYGPMKPVGLIDPKTGKEPYAVVQLRPENIQKTLYSMVGFQTRLKFQEQRRIFRMIPGLENAEFARYGVMHRNTYFYAPKFLKPTLQFIKNERVFFAGQLIGVEGYMESAAMGIVAGINAARLYKGKPLIILPPTTMIGALISYVTTKVPVKQFQPMNANWGILLPLERPVKDKKLRNRLLAERALRDLDDVIRRFAINV
ncbi:methylenetetrahydrofolate--tRNA-(uracil(54)-C(5))-methyltransferase (FADH(2)-oxidizing) TrmFO [Dictyoglomus thermophilum]|uniref:Methylenetetrahydrofolate--tRNA-(uracil-5-)-methyltransferase TrmFO n=2 Tax=Dictyoglomus thermophilum TaxID=14 RepID=TRMFO_DICT6|nr:methylenetetrahydrofolate--tRNA-(uracil(54)-C(5))-methyltransferase (FADH(2)-oxidizing) TrmFO [Dictyoglomus thermophilum]B5YFC6.1 RecName: Full=Methylenetetrahydrofolate--tRNA-(uracil-5-)-methyltransferase TrmFO; AltName: Full=Folate-dependent tRNA (uracil-5-)-methyltransferase; AltName: Full=Folate-dependent tRNA(M-5-U54)-methyltransferase [Dictyoglomus thermophilum H-6-12]ACI18814.1 gid protein [Dictyoglomus thermophilum H-6-12]MCX7719849.1 methylenetetrahydrofolate--tRNA-(uracil(54)-C(5))-